MQRSSRAFPPNNALARINLPNLSALTNKITDLLIDGIGHKFFGKVDVLFVGLETVGFFYLLHLENDKYFNKKLTNKLSFNPLQKKFTSFTKKR